MRFNNANIGSNKTWAGILVLVVLILILSPAELQLVDHLRQPHLISCEGYTLRIPMMWSLDDEAMTGRCAHGVVLVKRAATIFGSEDHGSSITILPEGSNNEPQRASVLEDAFKTQHNNMPTVPFSLNRSFDHCILIEEERSGRRRLSVFCSETAKGVAIDFSGSRHALTEVSALLR